jgi:hypothetical protein
MAIRFQPSGSSIKGSDLQVTMEDIQHNLGTFGNENAMLIPEFIDL